MRSAKTSCPINGVCSVTWPSLAPYQNGVYASSNVAALARLHVMRHRPAVDFFLLRSVASCQHIRLPQSCRLAAFTPWLSESRFFVRQIQSARVVCAARERFHGTFNFNESEAWPNRPHAGEPRTCNGRRPCCRAGHKSSHVDQGNRYPVRRRHHQSDWFPFRRFPANIYRGHTHDCRRNSAGAPILFALAMSRVYLGKDCGHVVKVISSHG